MYKRKATVFMLLSLVIAVPLAFDPFAFAEEQAQVSRLPPLPRPLDPILQGMFDKRRAMGGAVIQPAMPQNLQEHPELWRPMS